VLLAPPLDHGLDHGHAFLDREHAHDRIPRAFVVLHEGGDGPVDVARLHSPANRLDAFADALSRRSEELLLGGEVISNRL
jgi:hypothetical protein